MLFVVLLILLCVVPSYAGPYSPKESDRKFSYQEYCFEQALLKENEGHTREAANWYFKYVTVSRRSEKVLSPDKFMFAHKKLEEFRKKALEQNSSVQEKQFESTVSNIMAEAPKQKRRKSTKVSPRSGRQRRVPRLTASELLSRAQKAEQSGQLEDARRFYRLALKLEPTLDVAREKIKELDGLLQS